MPEHLKRDLFAAVCGQFGNDNANIRISALNRANLMLSKADTDWASLLSRNGVWAEALERSAASSDPEKAETAARVNASVVKAYGTWPSALGAGTGDEQGDDFDVFIDFETFLRAYISGLTMRGGWGYAHPAEEQDRQPPRPSRQPPPPPEPIPVVVEGTIALSGNPSPPGSVKFTVTREDGRVFGPFAALKPKVKARIASGTGTRMRVTTRSGTGPFAEREATRAVSA